MDRYGAPIRNLREQHKLPIGGRTMRKTGILLFALFYITFQSGCERESTGMDYNTKNIPRLAFSYTSADSVEAAELALWLSAELQPPQPLTDDLMYRLKYLRHKYGDIFPIVIDTGRFLTPWVISQVACKVDSATAGLIRNHAYRGWDNLPVSLRPDSIIYYPDKLGWCILGFKERYHPRRLAEIYATLPGFILSEPNFIIFSGLSSFPFFPGLVDGSFVIVFHRFPLTNHFYYFRYEGDEPFLVGLWDSNKSPEPDWWTEAERIFINFGTWDGN